MSVATVQLTGAALAGIAPQLHTAGSLESLPKTVKLGRIEPKARPQTLHLRNYLLSAPTPPPATVDYAEKAKESIKRMYLNDTYGDCVIAGKYHAVGVWSGNKSGTAILGTDQEVYSAYQTICGPGDNGCDISTVLNYMRDKGLSFNGVNHKIDGYVAVDWTNKLEVQVALFVFGAKSIGINLPQEWTNSAVWDVTNSPIVGGHDVTPLGYNDQGVQIASWGRIYTITWAAFTSTRYLSEAYVMLAPDWYGNDKLSPTGIEIEKLKADLNVIGGGGVPSIDPTPVPPVPVPVPPVPVPPPAPVLPPSYAGTATMTGHIPYVGNVTFSGPVTLAPVAAKAGPAKFNFDLILAMFRLYMDVRALNNGKLIADVHALVSSGFSAAAFITLYQDLVSTGTNSAVLADLARIAADLGVPLPFAPAPALAA